MCNIFIQPMTMRCYEAVIALWQACDGVGLSDADSPENIARYLERNPGMSFVAEVNGRLAGAVLSGHDGRRGYIHHLAVHPDFRRQGIGRTLIERCLAALRTAGIQKCHLFVFGENENAVKFWRDTGWTERAELAIFSQQTSQKIGIFDTNDTNYTN
ncbi:MAG: GNAT family N-acetyltransferase [Chloroflexi bacterium]|nr:GNAT family N-acetyltransferase [Chloroflexota bacterium]